MRTIIVDDEPIMIKSFLRLSKNVSAIEVVGQFTFPMEALEFVRNNSVDLALLDISMPGITGLELAQKLREIQPNLLVVFITAHDNYIRESNELNVDGYIMKPYTEAVIQQMAERMERLVPSAEKNIYLQMFGRFTVFKDGKPLAISGHAKEILALVATRRGKEISNEEIYSTIWENREYSNIHMKVYYNALKRLKVNLEKEGISDLLQSTQRGQILNTAMVDCDYYSWQDNKPGPNDRFDGEFLSEYSWGEYILAGLLNEYF